MGFTHVHVDVGNAADPERTRSLQFLADSGAVYSVVPGTVLNELGIRR